MFVGNKLFTILLFLIYHFCVFSSVYAVLLLLDYVATYGDCA